MCIICVELLKHRMTLSEARRAADEMVRTSKNSEETKHVIDLIYAIDALEKLGNLLEEGDNS